MELFIEINTDLKLCNVMIFFVSSFLLINSYIIIATFWNFH